ncbi:MAG: CPBP family intramembrane glutamic endopeptidase [Oscillatoria sp. PMC 1068.18]|nr:CPBP family intramembrane glutamic endopeptidase [Oscillatoria sp. PMC 1068.18]
MASLITQFYDWVTSSILTNGILRAIAFLLIWVIVWLPIAIPVAKLVKWNPAMPMTEAQKLPLLASLYLIVPLVLGGWLWLQETSLSAYGFGWRKDIFVSFGWGLSLSIAGLGVVFGCESWLGWIDWHWEKMPQLFKICFPLLGLGLGIGFVEELVFRGFLLSELRVDYSLGVAGVISSTVFALLHLFWERKETILQLPGLFLLGMVLVLARWVDNGSLGLAWGLHAGWIWGLSSLNTAELISYTGKGSVWLTGFGKQPLAGGAGIFCLFGTAMVLWWFGFSY